MDGNNLVVEPEKGKTVEVREVIIREVCEYGRKPGIELCEPELMWKVKKLPQPGEPDESKS